MAEIPESVLSERIQATLQGRRLHTAVFTTFEFDPAFLEQEVVPILLDESISHVTSVRLVQLEDQLRTVPGGISVYYDADRLSISDAGSGRLDIRRIPVRHHKGVFHPKNVFLLLEAAEPDEENYRARTLVVASLSANLTRAGWWENVEVGHVEEVPEGGKTRLRSDLLDFLADLQKSVGARSDRADLSELIRFLKGTEQRQQRTLDGRLLPHFYSGRQNFVDFLVETAGDGMRGCYLELISPYFDDAPACKVLHDLIERFEPREVRIFLPRSDAGVILCREDFFKAVSSQPNVRWGHMPGDMLGMGRGESVKKRFVHAKVCRFFTRNPAREICFVGSANLTRRAYERRNVESGFVVEIDAARRPEFWLLPDEGGVDSFAAPGAEDDEPAEGSFPLDVRYHWNANAGEVYWDASDSSPAFELQSRGVLFGAVPPLPSRQWTPLPADVNLRLAQSLPESSLVDVIAPDRAPARILVQEEGMSHKPSLLRTLSAADILRYWSLLTAEQRAAFIADRAQEIKSLGLGLDLVVPFAKLIDHDTIFDRFAGIFHAFGALEREVLAEMEEGRTRVADYRIFGMKYDSLGSLLERLNQESTSGDVPVEGYVTLLCARQLLQLLPERYPDYWAAHADDVRRLGAQMDALGELRTRLIDSGQSDLPAFLEWFDRWFLKRATGPVAEAASD